MTQKERKCGLYLSETPQRVSGDINRRSQRTVLLEDNENGDIVALYSEVKWSDRHNLHFFRSGVSPGQALRPLLLALLSSFMTLIKSF